MADRTPAQWRDLLVKALDHRWSSWKVYDNYYEGDQVLSYMTRKFRDVYGNLFALLSDNWMRIVVDSKVERMHVQGFRFGAMEDADDEAWEIWQNNGLDGESNMVHTESAKLGESYWLVQPDGDTPKITAEHPSQVIVYHAPGDRRNRLAALKKWRDDDGFAFANVYLPDRVYKYRTKQELQAMVGLFKDEDKWNPIGSVPNPLGVVPIVPVPNNPSMLHGGRSDLAGGVISLQDAINKLLCDLLIGSEYMAFPQRVLLGVEQPRDARGQPIPMEKLDQAVAESRLWMFPGENAKAFEFSAAELTNIREGIDGLIRDLTAQTRTPPHYVSGQIVNASGDALKAAETGLVSKVRDAMDPYGEAHEETMRLAFKSIDADDPRAQAMDAETIWKDPESRSQAELADSLTKLATIGVPQEILWERYGFSPQEIDRMAAMKEAEALIAATLGPPLTPTAQPQNGATPVPTPAAPVQGSP